MTKEIPQLINELQAAGDEELLKQTTSEGDEFIDSTGSL